MDVASQRVLGLIVTGYVLLWALGGGAICHLKQPIGRRIRRYRTKRKLKKKYELITIKVHIAQPKTKTRNA